MDTFFSHEGGQVALQFAGTSSSNLSHRYLWGPAVDLLLADESVTSLSSAGSVQYPLGDHLGTLRDLAAYDAGTNTTTIDNHRRYDTYGNASSETNAAVDQLFSYTGRPYDETTGKQNNLNRWYDASTAQWMNEDPIGLAGDPSNLYRYVQNAPLQWTDSDGLVRRKDRGTIGGDRQKPKPPVTLPVPGAPGPGEDWLNLVAECLRENNITAFIVPAAGLIGGKTMKVKPFAGQDAMSNTLTQWCQRITGKMGGPWVNTAQKVAAYGNWTLIVVGFVDWIRIGCCIAKAERILAEIKANGGQALR